jgi:hypothetical protein
MAPACGRTNVRSSVDRRPRPHQITEQHRRCIRIDGRSVLHVEYQISAVLLRILIVIKA